MTKMQKAALGDQAESGEDGVLDPEEIQKRVELLSKSLARVLRTTKGQESVGSQMVIRERRAVDVKPRIPRLKGKVVLDSLESVLGEQWEDMQETAWAWAYDRVAGHLRAGLERMEKSLSIIQSDWKTVTGQLGKEALAAKISAHLMVESVTATAATPRGSGGGESDGFTKKSKSAAKSVGQKAALAKDLVSLLEFLVEAVSSLDKLRGVMASIGVPWSKVFANFGKVPNVVRLRTIVVQALSEAVGDREWNAEHEEIWVWLWQLVEQEKESQWTPEEAQTLREVWASVERNVILSIEGDPNSAVDHSRDIFVDTTCAAVFGAAPGKKPAGLMPDELVPQTTEQKEPTGADTEGGEPRETVGERRKKMSALERRLEKAPKVRADVASVVCDKFFDILFKRAPTHIHIWVKGNDMYYTTFQKQMIRVLAYADAPASIWADDRDLAVEHVNFGVTPADLPVYGKVWGEVFRHFVPEAMGMKAAATVEKYMVLSLQGLGEIIMAASHPLTRALITRNLSDVSQALREAPRGFRSAWACNVQIAGEGRSPILWMVDSGYADIARVLIRDVLAIRQNRTGIYYGKDVLWQTHGGELVDRICKSAPELLVDLLDGHIWCSNRISRGTRRVIFFVRELWGDPMMTDPEGNLLWPDLNKSLLPSVARLRNETVASHPVCKFITLLAFLLGFCILDHGNEPTMGAMIVGFQSLACLLAFVSMGLIGHRVWVQWSRGQTLPRLGGMDVRFQVPFHLSLGSSWHRIVSSLLIVALYLEEIGSGTLEKYLAGTKKRDTDPAEDPEKVIAAAGVIFLLLGTFDLFVLWKYAAVTFTIICELLATASTFLSVSTLLLIGSAFALSQLAKDELDEAKDFPRMLGTLIGLLCKIWDPPWAEISWTTAALILVLMITFVFLLTNALVATFVQGALEVHGKASRLADLGMLCTIADIELSMQPETLHHYATSIDFNRRLTFTNKRIPGVTGGVQVHLSRQFQPPKLGPGKRADRIETYTSEQSEEIPWPSAETNTNDGGGDDGEDIAEENLRLCVALEKKVATLGDSLNRSFRNLRAVKKTIGQRANVDSIGDGDDGLSQVGSALSSRVVAAILFAGAEAFQFRRDEKQVTASGEEITVNPSKDLLVIIDVQNCFTYPDPKKQEDADFITSSGCTAQNYLQDANQAKWKDEEKEGPTLAVSGSRTMVGQLETFQKNWEGHAGNVAYTLDVHPSHHISFANPKKSGRTLFRGDQYVVPDYYTKPKQDGGGLAMPTKLKKIEGQEKWTTGAEEITLANMQPYFWPRHCVKDTFGGKLSMDELPGAAKFHKGTDEIVESFSGLGGRACISAKKKPANNPANREFKTEMTMTVEHKFLHEECKAEEASMKEDSGLLQWLKDKMKEDNTRKIFVTGLAYDFCVFSTVVGIGANVKSKALPSATNFYIIPNLTRGVVFDLFGKTATKGMVDIGAKFAESTGDKGATLKVFTPTEADTYKKIQDLAYSAPGTP
uniref:Isochorismatase-like domain-containing protein n=1 Tax=Chromera velia CCMP2878 TaxID=1169474 RepID=A0A0G4F4W6_9ALVE|eukprot:Cvel_15250.t1-p1 / transcript=Cvel_15250.t1 / gene=Cvel_15250 / organism=Chromera_velia_CCMP2878 / gene_product=hypothetical protein / transcript_product=hypothetical protein / location=Cvel_scaffold1117:4575-26617(-) / protein_length=1487 / sequence_SO=supercontig / SO=protein_coding / is_pseudo=false